MDYRNVIESTLDALILNASALQETADAELSNQQSRLLDSLFNQWNALSDEQRNALLEEQLESKVQLLAKKNQSCLRTF